MSPPRFARRWPRRAKGAWIQGRGWDEGKLTERRVITAKDLDAVSPDNPVVLTQTTGHYVVANSVALSLAGVTKDTRDPPNGTIDRNADGTPTGLLREGAAGLVRRLVPPALGRGDRSGDPRLREGVQRRGDDRPQGSRASRRRRGTSTRRSSRTARSTCACSRSGQAGARSMSAKRADRRACGDDEAVRDALATIT